MKKICSNCGKERFFYGSYCRTCTLSIQEHIKQTRHELESNLFYTTQESNMFLYGEQNESVTEIKEPKTSSLSDEELFLLEESRKENDGLFRKLSKL